jgi:FkbM family methyltransferase
MSLLRLRSSILTYYHTNHLNSFSAITNRTQQQDTLLKLKKIIYDFGCNNGDDIPYYLLKADLVVAIEANPELCKLVRSKFKSEIQEKRLAVECCVVTDTESEQDVPFYIHKKEHVLSQFPKPKKENKFDKVLLPSRSVYQLISKHGPPYYIKIDIEYYDAQLLNAIFKHNIYPPYISAEYKSIEIIALLFAYGRYKKFKLIDGKSIATTYSNHTISHDHGDVVYSFPYHSAGPFGDDILGDWMQSFQFIRLLISKGVGWKDIHATSIHEISSSSSVKRYKIISTIRYSFIKGLFSLTTMCAHIDIRTIGRRVYKRLWQLVAIKMRAVKQTIRRIFRTLGYDIRRLAAPSNKRPVSNNAVGRNPFDDIASFLGHKRPVILDVGANVGQSVWNFRSRFSDCILHSFEPSPSTFEKLSENVQNLADVHLWNYALGSTPGQMNFLENSKPKMSSFLPLSDFGWGEITKETTVDVSTVDAFCASHGIETIDILKTDTQGYDYEVFKGCEAMMRAGNISLIYFEIIFSDMYKDLPSFGEVFEFLEARNFRLVSFYEIYYQERLASWTDALFVHDSVVEPRT